MNSKILKNSILFYLSGVLILAAEILFFEYKTIFLCLIPLSFLFIHFQFFTKNFNKEFVFVVLAFIIGFCVELTLTNISVFHFGLVDIKGFKLPPPWITSFWLIFPVYLITSLQLLNKYKAIGAYFLSAAALAFYYFIGEKFDLIFFETPKNKSFIVFILIWYLLVRGLFLLNKILVKKLT